MYQYGSVRKNSLTCDYGCCSYHNVSKKYTRGHRKLRHKEYDKAAKTRARQESKKQANDTE